MDAWTSDKELSDFAKKHLWHEIWMLHALTGRLFEVLEHDARAGRRDLEWLDLETRNAQLESFVIHARNLLDFFYQGSRKKQDALARDYVSGQWSPLPMTPALKQVNPRAGSGLAHLSYDRLLVSEEAKAWDYWAIWIDLAKVIRSFVARAPTNRLPASLGAKILVLLPSPPDEQAISRGVSTTSSESYLSVGTTTHLSPARSKPST